ncbi:N-acetylglucosamine kinase [Paeniglutamicibacter sp. NPDC091659]|uniref:N-acetylglucosamine kinase n=1 Tax=Paeniglutamicibacter sp. NPDC091659 TaxID=3364389 RepID=UPI003820957A
MMTILSIDAGQSGMRVRLRAADGTSRELSRPGVRTDSDVITQLAAAIDSIAAEPDMVLGAANVGTSGVDFRPELAGRLKGLVPALASASVRVAHDSISGYLGSAGTELGVTTAVGTGVVTLGVGDGGVHRVDGWGHLLGDCGSGFWIGRAGLEAAMRAYDGRGESTVLLDDLIALFGEPAGAYLRIQSDPDRVRSVASFARVVLDAAEAGDAVASDVAMHAANELYTSMDAALRQAGFAMEDAPVVCWTGGVVRSQVLAQALVRRFAAQWPNARLLPALGDPLDGSERLGDLSPSHPLFASISRA